MTRIASSFVRSADDWTIAGDVAAFEWRPSGGEAGGYLFWEDAAAGSDSYWQAPAKFLGDLSEFAGGRLTFAWYASADTYQAGDVLLTGANGVTLVGDVTNPGTDWTDAAIRLGTAGQWHIGSPDGALATARQIKAVLADVTQLQIRAEHVAGGETGGLDSVALVSRPAAAAPADAFGPDRHHAFLDAATHHAADVTHVALV